MRVLIDECIPARFKRSVLGHECKTVPDAGFAGKKNGELLALAEQAGFNVFITVDNGIAYQQNLANHQLAIIFLRAKSNRLDDLSPLVPECLAAMPPLKPGQILIVPS